MKQLNEKKYERQLIGVNKFFNSGTLGLSHKDRCGCLNYCTGVGKTFTATLILKEYKNRGQFPTTVILVPSHLIKQWEGVIASNFTLEDRKKIKLYSPDYVLTNKLILNPQLLIVDEVDAFYSEKRFNLLNKTYIRYIDFLSLTATYEDINNRHLDFKPFCPIIDKISEKEALKEGYISKYIEYNFGLEFTEEEQEAHDRYSTLIREGLSKFGKQGLNLAIKCLSGGKHENGTKYTSTQFCQGWAQYNGWHKEANQETQDLWHPHKVFGYAVNLFKVIKKRKDLIYNNSVKLETSVKLLQKFSNTKTVVFSQSTIFANTLYGIINEKNPNNAVIYHSNVETQYFPSPKTGDLIKHGKVRLKKRAIRRINEGSSNHLITSSVLDKGLDIPDLKMGITTSGTQNPTQYKQRKGRPIRLDTDSPDSVSILINMYMKNSKEVDWLKKRQSESNNIIYWIEDVNEISYKPKVKQKINIKDI